MSPSIDQLAGKTNGFPRVSGDEPAAELGFQKVGGFSPRERG